jgi:hypothetical protein
MPIPTTRHRILGLDADHSNICKFPDPDGEEFQRVSYGIKVMMREAIDAQNAGESILELGRYSRISNTQDILAQLPATPAGGLDQ